ncbi:MAG: hypothetical protein KAR54_01115 [Candidatus Pacebacteria bacterium]|nr:hypothetical protein [Candidatus Paceibacterota bacterium]
MKKVYFIGIAGVGMSAVAKLLKDKGWDVSGSDQNCYPPISDYLDEQKIPYKTGYNKSNIPENVDLFVLGRNAKLRPDINEEVKAVMESGIEIKSFPEILADLSKDTENVVVVGSYAKSTCTAMIAHCLEDSNKEPNYFIGAVPVGKKETSKIGKNNVFIIEGDEYPADIKENKSKFLYLKTDNILLTSAEHDHINIFPTKEDYLKPFEELLKKVPNNGLVVACVENGNVEGLINNSKSRVVAYGLERNDKTPWYVENIKYGKTSSFDIIKNGEKIVSLETTLLGKHNLQNILGVSVMLLEKDLITTDDLKKSIKSFGGIKRRMELKTKTSEVPVYEGFGSSYEKARSAIEAMKTHFPDKKLVVVFEPHTFSWRNKGKIHWYDDVFSGCEKVFVFAPPTQGSDTHEQSSSEEIVERIKSSGMDTRDVSNENIEEKLKDYLELNHSVLLLSSGDFGGMIDPIANLVEDLFKTR